MSQMLPENEFEQKKKTEYETKKYSERQNVIMNSTNGTFNNNAILAVCKIQALMACVFSSK